MLRPAVVPIIDNVIHVSIIRRPEPKIIGQIQKVRPTPRQAETARRLAVETWLQSNRVITITQNQKVLPVFSKKTAHN